MCRHEREGGDEKKDGEDDVKTRERVKKINTTTWAERIVSRVEDRAEEVIRSGSVDDVRCRDACGHLVTTQFVQQDTVVSHALTS